MNKLPDFRRFRVVWYLVFRLVLADSCSLLRPIFPFVLPILNLLFMITHLISLNCSCFPTLFSWYEIWLVISWNMNYVPDMRKKGVCNKRQALVDLRKHMGTPPSIFGEFCLLGLVHSWLYLLTLIKGKLHSVEQLF
jgi:hypothetical protein